MDNEIVNDLEVVERLARALETYNKNVRAIQAVEEFMTEPEEQKCSNCMFYSQNRTNTYDHYCLFNPPVVVVTGRDNNEVEMGYVQTNYNDWCGQWKLAPKKDEEEDNS